MFCLFVFFVLYCLLLFLNLGQWLWTVTTIAEKKKTGSGLVEPTPARNQYWNHFGGKDSKTEDFEVCYFTG